MSTASPIAELYSNPNGWIVREPYGKPVGFSSKDMLAAIKEAEGNGYFVRWGFRIVDEQFKAELRYRVPSLSR